MKRDNLSHCFVVFLLLLAISEAQIDLTETCGESQYFDTSSLRCEECLSNQSPSSSGRRCECDQGYKYNDDLTFSFKMGCQLSCSSSSQVLGPDNSTCVSCSSGVTDYECLCSSGYALIDVSIDGNILSTKRCVECGTSNFPGFTSDGRSPTECKSCSYGEIYNTDTNPYTCECDTNSGFTLKGDLCLEDSVLTTLLSGYSEENAKSLTYENVRTSSNEVWSSSASITDSQTFEYLYAMSAYMCSEYSQMKACQALANLCVLAMYDETHTVCRFFMYIMESRSSRYSDGNDLFSGWKEDLPFLYYSSSFYEIVFGTVLKMTISFKQDSETDLSTLPVYVASYSLAGEMLGIEKLQTEMILCPSSEEDGFDALSFGTMYTNECSYDLSSLMSFVEPVFYELWLEDVDGTIYGVPVLVENFVDQDGNNPNRENVKVDADFENEVFPRLTRRFFIEESVSGITEADGFENQSTAEIVQYAEEVTLRVFLNNKDGQTVYLPFLQIRYAQRRVSDMESGDTEANVSYETKYEMDLTAYSRAIKILFGAYHIFIILVFLARMGIWFQHNPSMYEGDNWFFKLLTMTWIYLVRTWTYCVFFFVYLVSAFFFTFYKFQDKIFILIPNSGDALGYYVPFIVVTAVMFGGMILNVLAYIFLQTNCDYYLLDWEKSKKFKEKPYKVNVWRSIYIANELNELQTGRYISFNLTFFIFAVLMVGFNFENMANNSPDISLSESYAKSNYVLKFFLSTTILLITGLVQWLIKTLFTHFLSSNVLDFIDLLSVSNISIVILRYNEFNGYYLHGQSPGGMADTTAEDLKMILEREAKGSSKGRGFLTNDKTNLQSFEIYIPAQTKSSYQTIVINELEKEISMKKNIPQLIVGRRPVIPPTLPRRIDLTTLENQQKIFSSILKMLLEGVVADSNRNILDKTPGMRFFGLPPAKPNLMTQPIFYRDPLMNWQEFLFYGIDVQLLIIDIVFYNFIDWSTRKTLASILCTYAFNRAYVLLKSILAQRNISKKTIIDDRFFL